MNTDFLNSLDAARQLQDVVKIYLMAAGGTTTQLGGVTCALLDALIDSCSGDHRTTKKIEDISISIVKVVYTSVAERMEEPDFNVFDQVVTVAKENRAKVESATTLLPHLLFLKKLLDTAIDLNKAKDNPEDSLCHPGLLKKLQELIDAVRP